MNIERYTLPVIIAAGLHGALLLSFSAKNPPPHPDAPYVGPVLPPLPPLELTDPVPVDPGEAGGGKAEPLSSQIDIPRPKSPTDFTVPVTPYSPTISPVVNLPDNPTSPIGPGDMNPNIGGPRLPDAHHLDRNPRATVRPAPNYPATMHSSSTSGSVTVEFVVDTTGRVVTAEAVKWSHRDFVDPAVRAVLLWRFEPGKLNNRPVRFRMAVPIEFNAER